MSHKNFRSNHLELMKKAGREPIQPPRVLEHIRKTTISGCERLLAHLFSATDDLFYDLSKRASSNSEQNLYFEAMREIRIKREGIANAFLQSVADQFSALIEFQTLIDERNPDSSPRKLSIVEGDELEVDLARGSLVSRTRDVYREELYELNTRFDHLLLQVAVDEDNNPVDPQQLTDAFIEVCQSKLDVNIKAKLILYKLFEKHVLKQLGHIYADANEVLIDAGILPKVPKMADPSIVHGGVNDRRSGADLAPQANATQHANEAPPIDFRMGYDALNALMAAARSLVINQAGQGGNLLGYFYTGNPGPVMASPELTALLTSSQTAYDQQLAAANTPRNIITEVMQQLLKQNNPKEPQALEQNDENIINLVAMFFDQALADETLPVAIQSVICRMQIPILKVALKDRTFFSNPEHPARCLINAITEAGLGFDNSKPIERDPLYKKIVDIVQTLNRQYKADDRIFAELQAELDSAIEREKRKASMVEQRTTQTEAGKSRIKQARSTTQSVMYQKLKDVELPTAINEFLTKHWLQVMVITHLKHGAESSEWVSNEQTITDLIWISNRHDDVRSNQRRERLLPELLDRIEASLAVAVDNPDIRRSKVAVLEETITAIHGQADLDANPFLEDYLQQETTAPVTETVFTPLSEEQKDALGKGENSPKSWDEMTAVERQQARYEELSSRYYELAKGMPEGSWLEYFDDETGKTLRCKLTSKIDAETYIFVNRFGFKALEKTRKQFAYDMQFNRARLLDTNPVFDRVMGNVVNHLSQESV